MERQSRCDASYWRREVKDHQRRPQSLRYAELYPSLVEFLVMGLAAAHAEAKVRLQAASTAACRCVTSCRILIRRERLPCQFFSTC
jgi:hypothetical protein